MAALILVLPLVVSRLPRSSILVVKQTASCCSRTANSSLRALLPTPPPDQLRLILRLHVTTQMEVLIRVSALAEKHQFPSLIAPASRRMLWPWRLTGRSLSQEAPLRP